MECRTNSLIHAVSVHAMEKRARAHVQATHAGAHAHFLIQRGMLGCAIQRWMLCGAGHVT